jgi:hypothetical protein
MGGPLIFFSRPIAVAFLLSALILVMISMKFFKRIPKKIIEDGSKG